ILNPTHPATALLTHPTLLIQRHLEPLTLLAGFEQANNYTILSPTGAPLGHLSERAHGLRSALARQAFRTHRGFTAHVFDTAGSEVLRVQRPFAWINSRLRVLDPQMRLIGEVQQEWAPLRRRYNLFTLQPQEGTHTMAQFARIDAPFLSWDFRLQSDSGAPLASVNRNFSGFAREIFTETGVYALRMDAAAMEEATATEGQHILPAAGPGLTLDQRAVALATAVSIDFDYFSRHSGAGGGFM
ncbi:Scramblase, partial [Trichodelitschia bisporula]